MKLLNIVAILITLTAAFGYVTRRFTKLPTTIGIMLVSILVSLGVFILGRTDLFGFNIREHWLGLVRNIDFNKTLMVGMLGFLLFAGALDVDLQELKRQKWRVAVLSTLGVVISTFVTGSLLFAVAARLGLGLKYIHCLLFGALISPTDPVAVISILRDAGLSKKLDTVISGEALFNDGVGVVVFVTLFSIASGEHNFSPAGVALFFLSEVLGGCFLGAALGWTAYLALKNIDDYQIEILITLALVMGGYALATAIHTSGPIAIVVAGLIIGHHGRKFAMSEKTRQQLSTFWELVDQILNSLLFVLIGLELIVVQISWLHLAAGLAAIPISLLARSASIAFLVMLERKFRTRAATIMVWGGLRGGIAVALALSLPAQFERDTFMAVTYTVVVFSILVQGLTIKYFVQLR